MVHGVLAPDTPLNESFCAEHLELFEQLEDKKTYQLRNRATCLGASSPYFRLCPDYGRSSDTGHFGTRTGVHLSRSDLWIYGNEASGWKCRVAEAREDEEERSHGQRPACGN
jgi:hypothetical protein